MRGRVSNTPRTNKPSSNTPLKKGGMVKKKGC